MLRIPKAPVLALAAAVAAAGTLGALALAPTAQQAAHAGEAAARLATAAAAYRDVDLTYPAEGVVEAVRQAVVAARVPGRIVDLKVDAGDRVKAGQVLARIDEREATQAVAEARAQVARAEADLTNARANYERTQKLVAEKFMSAATLDKARADFRAAEAQLAAARAGAEQAATSKDYAAVTAPFAGLVAARHAQVGEMAQPGLPIVTVYDPSEMRVVASVPQATASELRGRTLSAYAELPTLAKTVKARAVTVLPAADPRTLTTTVRLDLPEPLPGAVPGTFARAHFATGRAQRLVVPASAIVQRSEVAGVYVVSDSGAVQLRQLRLGERAGDQVEVLAGLDAGEQVALDPAAALAQLRAARAR
jgi:RND family efflux transporter MFP subunit